MPRSRTSELELLTRGFRRLNRDDKQMLRAWFNVPARATEERACQIIAASAPQIIREDLIYQATAPSRCVPA